MKTYTQFRIKGYPDLHLTHKYFGEVTEIQLARIHQTVWNYFSKRAVESFKCAFPIEDYFGQADETVRVLKPMFRYGWMNNLRDVLDEIKETPNYPKFNPHVTTELPAGTVFEFISYELVVNNKVYFSVKFDG